MGIITSQQVLVQVHQKRLTSEYIILALGHLQVLSPTRCILVEIPQSQHLTLRFVLPLVVQYLMVVTGRYIVVAAMPHRYHRQHRVLITGGS